MSDRAYAHFIGVGGAGMSGIALVLHARGIPVTGSDLKESRYSRALVDAGVPVFIGHDASNLGEPKIVVVSAAIPDRNPELAEARRREMDVWPRAKMLAHLAGDSTTVAVAGTHGKTSTSSMIATMLSRMGLDPTFLIGGEVDGFDTNAANGAGDHFVVEADESDGSFLYLTPDVAVVTNIEADHMDHYGSLAQIESIFAEFMERTCEGGTLVVCGDDERLVEIARDCNRPVLTYGFSDECDVRCRVVERVGEGFEFTASVSSGESVSCSTAVPGLHMVSNATAALATAFALGVELSAAATALSSFTGVRRRFDHVGSIGGVSVVDDYAHHPTEVGATLEAAVDLGYRRVWVVFQPHRYSRTQAFSKEFGESFAGADRIVLMDVYSAGEAPIPGVSGKTLLDAALKSHPRSRAAYLPHRTDVVPYLLAGVREGDLVMTMGAGDVTMLGPELIAALAQRAEPGAAE